MVMSRWGVKLHKLNCPCGVCSSKRKKQHSISKDKQKAEPDKDVSCTTVRKARQRNTLDAQANTACDAGVLTQSLHSEHQHGELAGEVLAASTVTDAANLSTATPASAHAQGADTHVRRADKPVPKVFLHYFASGVLVDSLTETPAPVQYALCCELTRCPACLYPWCDCGLTIGHFVHVSMTTHVPPTKCCLLQTRFSMELAALGTPDMPLNKTRVPRQAATAAKAAIKNDLLMQNSRPGATSVPPKVELVHKSSGVPAAKSAASTASKLHQKVHPSLDCKCIISSRLHTCLTCHSLQPAFFPSLCNTASALHGLPI